MLLDRQLAELEKSKTALFRELQAGDFEEKQHKRDLFGRFSSIAGDASDQIKQIKQKLTPRREDSSQEKIEQLKNLVPQIAAGLAVAGLGAIAAKTKKNKSARSATPKPADVEVDDSETIVDHFMHVVIQRHHLDDIQQEHPNLDLGNLNKEFVEKVVEKAVYFKTTMDLSPISKQVSNPALKREAWLQQRSLRTD